MRKELLDLMKQVPDIIDKVSVIGTAETTTVKSVDPDKTLIFEANFTNPISDLVGEFGIGNMKLLSGLMNFANYKSELAKITTKKITRNGEEIVEKLEFRNDVTGNQADFRLVSKNLVKDLEVEISQIPWNVTFVPEKSKISEFTQLANLFSDASKEFGVKTVEDKLIFYIGDENASTHNTNMVFKSEVEGKLSGKLVFETSKFLSAMRLVGANTPVISITSRGVLLISVSTEFAKYDYYLRGVS